MITSYNVIETPSGIIELVINTETRWVTYHQANSYTYFIGEGPNEVTLVIKEPFLNKNDMNYQSSSYQNKDQIVFYFIPKEMIGATKETFKKRKVINIKKF